MKDIYLKKREDRRIRAGHQWVFSNEVDVKRSPLTDFAPGESVVVRDSVGTFLGAGYVNPASLISVRIITRREGENIDVDLVRRRLKCALTLRETLFDVPYYRMCHSEGDFFPGLVIDRFGDTVSLQLNTAGIEAMREDVLSVIDDFIKPRVIVLRNDAASRTLEGLPRVVDVVRGTMPETVAVKENSVTFRAPFAPENGGQKTGWFFDQRPNRLAASLFGGESVLDAFCYAGGFGCMSGVGGAKKVTFLDASEKVLDFAAHNLLSIAPTCEGEYIRGDALNELAAMRESGRKFDTVCIDPPAFIKRRKDADAGLAAYRRVNDLALQLVRDGGIMVTCSCSHHLTRENLHRVVTQALVRRGLCGQLVYAGGQGPDHPIHPAMPETSYLKVLAFRVWK